MRRVVGSDDDAGDDDDDDDDDDDCDVMIAVVPHLRNHFRNIADQSRVVRRVILQEGLRVSFLSHWK